MLTRLQRKGLIFIEAELERTGGIAPTAREVADHFPYRTATTARRLLGLEERGFICEPACNFDPLLGVIGAQF